MCMRARESAYPVAVRLPCRCSLLPLGSMLSHHHNANLKSYHLLQTLMIEHASHLCVRSSHQAIHCASALVSAVASAASCFFVIGNRSKKSLAENPTELGGARRLWAPTCKHWMVSAATPAFPYLAEATSHVRACPVPVAALPLAFVSMRRVVLFLRGRHRRLEDGQEDVI